MNRRDSSWLWHCVLVVMIGSSPTVQLIAQYELRGFVSDTLGEGIPFAIITLVDTQAGVQYFAQSDSTGTWSMSAPRGSFVFTVRRLGFRVAQDTIAVPEGAARVERTVLVPDLRVLREVVVAAQPPPLMRRGDTLTFRIDSFITGQEWSLHEVLAKLPGFDVQQGVIRFKGRRVDKLFLNGLDLLGDQHQAAGELIRADMLDRIEAIERYKERIDAGDAALSEKVAINVVLKDELADKVNVSCEAHAGTGPSAFGRVHAFSTSSSSGFNGFGGAGNVFRPVLSPADMIHFKLNALPDPSGLSDIRALTDGLNMSSAEDRTRADAGVSLGATRTYSSGAEFRFNGLGGLQRQEREGLFSRTYWAGDGIVNGSFRQSQQPWFAAMAGNLYLPVTAKWALKLVMPAFVDGSSATDDFMGNVDSVSSEGLYKQHAIRWRVSPTITSMYSVSPTIMWRTIAYVDIKTERDRVSISDRVPLFNTGSTKLQQHASSTELRGVLRSGIQLRLGSVYLHAGLSLAGERLSKVSEAMPVSPLFSGRGGFRRVMGAPGLLIGRDSGKWLTEFRWRYEVTGTQLPTQVRGSASGHKLGMVVHFKPDPWTRYFLTFRNEREWPDGSWTMPVAEFLSPYSISAGVPDLFPPAKLTTVSVGVVKLSPGPVSLSISAGCTSINDGITWAVDPLGHQFRYSPFQTPDARTWTGQAMARWRPRHAPVSVVLRGDLNQRQGVTRTGGFSTRFRQHDISGDIRVSTEVKNGINGALRYSWMHGERELSGEGAGNRFSDQQVDVELILGRSKFVVQGVLSYVLPALQDGFLLCRVNARYQVSGKFQFFLDSYDLLRSMSRVRTALVFRPEVVEFRAWEARSAFLTLGALYDF